MPIKNQSSKSSTLMVDIPFWGKPTGSEKFIFHGNGKQPLSILVKKCFWKKEMCRAAKERVTTLCENNDFSGFPAVKKLLDNINSKKPEVSDHVGEVEVIEAFASIVLDQEYKSSQLAGNNSPVKDILEKIPEELKAEIIKPDRIISSEKLIDDIKYILLNKTQYKISRFLENESFDTLKNHLIKLVKFNTPETCSQLLEMLSSAKLAIGDPDTPYLKIVAFKINALHLEISNIYEELINVALDHKCETLRAALQQEMPVFERSDKNRDVLRTFLEFVRDPELDLNQPNVKRNLSQFINEFSGSVHQLKHVTRDLCLKEVDKLEGSLLAQENAYLPPLSTPALPADLLPLLAAIRDESKRNGPSGSLFNLFQYAQSKEAAISRTSVWFLSMLTDANFESISVRLEGARSKKIFSKIVNNLKADLANFNDKLNKKKFL